MKIHTYVFFVFICEGSFCLLYRTLLSRAQKEQLQSRKEKKKKGSCFQVSLAKTDKDECQRTISARWFSQLLQPWNLMVFKVCHFEDSPSQALCQWQSALICAYFASLPSCNMLSSSLGKARQLLADNLASGCFCHL